MPNLGVHVKEQATAVSIPVVADSGIPFVVGTAPVHTAEKPAKANTPVLCASWDEAVEKLGFSYDWKKYTLCEAMYSHFKLYGCQPVMGAADANGEYVVYYFAGYRDGKQLWEVDKRNMKCVIMGKDYMADIRKALGK